MARLGPEYAGKLPPGAAEELERSLNDYRNAAKDGVLKGVRILPGPGCAVSEAQEGVIYDIDRVPALPLAGCSRSPCCACCYSPVVEEF